MQEASTIGFTVAVHREDLFPVAIFLARLDSVTFAGFPSQPHQSVSRQLTSWRTIFERLVDYQSLAIEIHTALGLSLTAVERPTASVMDEVAADGKTLPTANWQVDIEALELLDKQVVRWQELHTRSRQGAEVLRRHVRCLRRLVDQGDADPGSGSREVNLTFGMVDPQKLAHANGPGSRLPLAIIPLALMASGLLVAAASRTADRPRLDRYLRSIDHHPIDQPADTLDNVAALLGDLQMRLAETTEQLRELEREREELVAEHSGWLTRLLARLRTELKAASLIVRHALFGKMVFFTGKIAETEVQDLVGGVDELTRREHVVLLSKTAIAEAGPPPPGSRDRPERTGRSPIVTTGITPPS